MKRITVIFLAAFLSVAAFAGDLNWYTDMETAKTAAKDQGKTMLLNFTGSDWCGWCKRLNREVFSKEEFKKFADENLILVMLDFPKYKKQSDQTRRANQTVLEKYGVRGFPTILLVNADEKLLLQTGYRRGGVTSYVEHLTPYTK